MTSQARPLRIGTAHALLGATVVALLAALSATTLSGQRGGVFRESRDHPAIRYSNGPTTDAVTALDDAVQSGDLALAFEPTTGYLHSVLAALNVPVESQVTVFSKTSFQADRIGPENPRAIFFNDTVAVGWVRGGDVLEIASLAGHDFMIDVALTRERGIAAVFAGEPRGAHAEAVEFVRESTLAGIEEPADAVITTSGGYPLDLTFYQAVKGITAASHIVKPGGTILLVAACREGFGGPEFRELMRRSPDARTLLDDLSQAPVVIDQWQAEKLALVASKARLMFSVPGVPAEDQSQLWGPAFQSPQEAVDRLTESLAPGASLVVIPEGPYVFSRIEPVLVA
jgi:hypothetical protein